MRVINNFMQFYYLHLFYSILQCIYKLSIKQINMKAEIRVFIKTLKLSNRQVKELQEMPNKPLETEEGREQIREMFQ